MSSVAAGQEPTCPAAGCGSSLELPRVVVGCWQLLERDKDKRHAVETLLAYARAGFTSFDTADIYGPSEAILGEFQKRWLKENPASPARFFTKYVTDNPSAAEAAKVNSKSLKDLGVETLDLVQFHWWSLTPDGSSRTFLEASRELRKLQKAGKIRALAGCNMDTTNLALLVDDGMMVEANQVQYSLLDRRPEVRMLPYCRERGIKLLVFGTVAGGLLSDSMIGLTKVEGMARAGDSVSRSMYRTSLQRWTPDWAVFQKLLLTLRAIGQRRSPAVPVAFVAASWVLTRMEKLGSGGGLIIGVRDTGHLEEHSALLRGDSNLSDDDMAEIQAVLDLGQAPAGDIWYHERGWLK